MPWFVANITEIECSSLPGNPESTFDWTSGDMKVDFNMSELIIGPLTKYNNGQIVTCIVDNDYTKRHGLILKSNVVHINVECEFFYFQVSYYVTATESVFQN